MVAPTATSAPPTAGKTTTNCTGRSQTSNEPGRFEWERAVRKARISTHLKGFLLYLGTFMSANGRDCRPSSRTIANDYEWSRQYVFQALKMAEESGWIKTDQRPGRVPERLPRIPDEAALTRQATPDGSHVPIQADPSRDTRRVNGHRRPPTRHVTPDYTRQATPDPTVTDTTQPGGTLPPDPLRPEHAPRTRNDHDQVLTLVVDLNGTKEVTTRPRAGAESTDRPLMTLVLDQPAAHEVDADQLELLDPAREAQWAAMHETIAQLTTAPTGATA